MVKHITVGENKMKHWAKNYDCCEKCHTTVHAHHGHGLCNFCYYQAYHANPADFQQKQKDNLEPFVKDLPILFRQVGITGYSASYDDGTVTIRKMNSKLSATWTATG